MKKYLLIIAYSLFLGNLVNAQELPILAQRFSNSFLYNPALVGSTEGAVELGYQRNWNRLDRNATNTYLGFQSPILDGSLGLGATVFREQIGFFATDYLSASTAYHLPLNFLSSLSFGVGVEYALVSTDFTNVRVQELNDPLLLNFQNQNQVDFTAGINAKFGFFQVGGSVNRLIGFVSNDEVGTPDNFTGEYFPSFITLQTSMQLPVANGRDIFEPRVNYRSFQGGHDADLLDLGLYYTVNKVLTAGASWRNNSTVNFSAAVNLQQFSIGYSRQSFTNSFRTDIGSSDEIYLRIAFNQNNRLGSYSQNSGSKKGGRNGSGSGPVLIVPHKKLKKPATSDRDKKRLRRYKGKNRKLIRNNKRKRY